MTKTELRTHLESGKGLVLRRKPAIFDGSQEAEKLKREIQNWNSQAQTLLNNTRGAKAAAEAFSQLGRMQYGTLPEVKEQLKSRRVVISEFLNGAKTTKSTPKPKVKSNPIKSSLGKVQKKGNRSGLPYDVCLSFAGEDRGKAVLLFKSLTANGLKVFYDEDEEVSAELWGSDLIAHLDDVYQNKARCCVMLLSKHYRKKDWTNYERESAQAREFIDRGYILPIRLDDTPIPGIRLTKGFKRWNEGVEKLTRAVLIKLGKKPAKVTPAPPLRIRATARTKGQRRAGHTVLLGSQLWQVEHLERVPDQHIVLRLKAKAQQLPNMRELVGSRTGSSYVPFVNGFDALDVQVSILKEETTKGGYAVTLKLIPKQAAQSYAIHRFGWNGQTAADVATLSVRQLLLGEKLVGDSYSSPPVSLPSQLQNGILPFAKRIVPRGVDGLQFAKFLSVYYLLSQGIVDVVKELKFKKQASGKIGVSFKGEISQSYGSQPDIVTVKGNI